MMRPQARQNANDPEAPASSSTALAEPHGEQLVRESPASREETRAERRERLRRLLGVFSDEWWELFVGSPKAVLRLQRIFVILDFCAVFSCLLQVLALGIWYEGELFWGVVLLAIITLSGLLTFCQACVQWRLYKTFKNLAMVFELYALPIGERLVQVLEGESVFRLQRLCLLLAVWYTFCLLYDSAALPCVEFQEFFVWRKGAKVIPCEVFEFFATLWFFANISMFVIFRRMPGAILRLSSRFQPNGSIGLPAALRALLPTHEFGAPGAPAPKGDSTCSICIEDLVVGEQVRLLPCGHMFHPGCVDTWLAEKARCPLRCPDNVWDAVRQRQRAAGLLPPELEEAFEIHSSQQRRLQQEAWGDEEEDVPVLSAAASRGEAQEAEAGRLSPAEASRSEPPLCPSPVTVGLAQSSR